MDSSASQRGEGDAEDEGLFVVIVGDKTDGQPQNLDNENMKPTIHLEIKPENSFLTCTEEMKPVSDIKTEDDFESMVEEYISDETYVTSDEDNKDDVTASLQLKDMEEKKYVENHDNSFMAVICRMNPELKDDTEALIEALYKVMKDVKPPKPPDGFAVEINNMFECVDCGKRRTKSRYRLYRHWQQVHGTRYLVCLACSTTFTCLSHLYRHEKRCKNPNAWLVLKARERVRQRKLDKKACDKDNTVKKLTKTVRDLKKQIAISIKSKASKHTKNSKVSKPVASKRGATKRKIVTKSKNIGSPKKVQKNSPKSDVAAKQTISPKSKNKGPAKKVKNTEPESDLDSVASEPYQLPSDDDEYKPEQDCGSDSSYNEDGGYSDPLHLLKIKRKRPVRKAANKESALKAKKAPVNKESVLEAKKAPVGKESVIKANKSPAEKGSDPESRNFDRVYLEIDHYFSEDDDDDDGYLGPDQSKIIKSETPIIVSNPKGVKSFNKKKELKVSEIEQYSSNDDDNDVDGYLGPEKSESLTTETPKTLSKPKGVKGSNKKIGPTVSHDDYLNNDDDVENVSKTAVTEIESGLVDSYLNRLRVERPDLMANEELLVQTLSDIMVKDKPQPPAGFVVIGADGLFQCAACDETSASSMSARRHWLNKHNTTTFKCYACGLQFALFRSLLSHEKWCKAKYAYIVRKARAPKKRSIEKQEKQGKKVNNLSATGMFICSFCPREFKRLDTLEAHENIHKGELPYKCKDCPAAYTSITALCHHKTRKHKEAKFLCDKCDRAFSLINQLRKHMDTHLNVKKYACSECVRRFSQKQDLKVHVDRDHRNLPYPFACKLCPQRYPLMTKLRTHVIQKHGINVISRKNIYTKLPEIAHAEVKPVTIAKKSALHTKADLPKISYDLEIVDPVKKEEKKEEFTDRSEDVDNDLPGGTQQHDENEAKKANECPHCKKRYACPKSLKKHVDRKHLLLVPFACNICFKRCAEEKYLRLHMLRHHGIELEKPPPKDRKRAIEKVRIRKPTIPKSEREFTYVNKEGVVTTFKMDSSGKLPCPECDKKYVNIVDVRKHVNKVHLNLPKPFACKLCDTRCMKMVTLRSHMLKVHGMQIIARKKLKHHLPKLTEEQLKNAITITKSDINPDMELPKPDVDSIDTGDIAPKPVENDTEAVDKAPMQVKNLPDTVDIDHDYSEASEPIEVDGDFTDTEVISNASPKKPVTPKTRVDTSAVNVNACTSAKDGLENEEEDEEMDLNYEDSDEGTDDGEYETEERGEPPQELKEIVKNHVGNPSKKKPMIVIKDGQAVFFDGENVEYFKKTSNCKVFKSPKTKVTVQYQEDFVSETNKALLSYYERFSQETTGKRTSEVEKLKPEVKKGQRTRNERQGSPGSSGRIIETIVRQNRSHRPRSEVEVEKTSTYIHKRKKK